MIECMGTPIKKNINKNFYLVNIVKHFDYFMNFIKYKKMDKLKIPFVLINEFISYSKLDSGSI